MTAARLARPKGTGAMAVYQELRREILDLELKPGAALEEEAVVARFGVSRTPVREALLRLWADGLITLLPNRGARVAPLELAKLREFFEALELCQRATTRWAALRATAADLAEIRREMVRFEEAVGRRDADGMTHANMAFHVAIATAADNDYIASSCSRLLAEGLRISKIAVTYDFDRSRSLADHLGLILAEHREMVAVIEARDAERAEQLGAAHAELARRRVIEGISATNAAEVGIPG